MTAPRARKPPRLDPTIEAVSFISSVLGEVYTCSDADGVYWGAYAALQDDGTRGYPVGLQLTPEPKITVSFWAARPTPRVEQRLFAIIGWAHSVGIAVEVD